MLTQAELKALLDYDPETGIFTWRAGACRCMKAGDVAGSPNKAGYVYIGINKRKYLAHRLAFLYMTGAFPQGLGDHRNLNPSDNRFDNLRPATLSQNVMNSKLRKDNTSGQRGVRFDACYGTWRARGHHAGREVHLGRHPTFELATAAYTRFAETHHGEFARAAF